MSLQATHASQDTLDFSHKDDSRDLTECQSFILSFEQSADTDESKNDQSYDKFLTDAKVI